MVCKGERIVAALCYLGALRVPVVALVLPEWAFTLPSGMLIAGAAWLYGRQHSTFLRHHGREGVRWTIGANLVLVAIALISKLLFVSYIATHWPVLEGIWRFSATLFRWSGILVSILTLLAMWKAWRGKTTDALELSR